MKARKAFRKDRPTTVVVNGYNLTHGGGLRIFQGLIGFLGKNYKKDCLSPPVIIFSPRHNQSCIQDAYALGLNVIIYRPTGIQQIDQTLLYFLYLPVRALFAQKSECLLNLGDYIVPYVSRQVYYFDWPYAIQDAKDVWHKMSLVQRINRGIKLSNIRIFVDTPDKVIVQSQFIARAMIQKLRRKSLVVIPCPVEKVSSSTIYKQSKNFSDTSKIYQFLCLSSFATHKNIEILLNVAKILKMRDVQFRIILTLDSKIAGVAAFLTRINESGMSKYFLNVGALSFSEVDKWFMHSDALLLPTKLETFGIPYVESLARQRPILTSDLPFAHELCKTGTVFFNPNDPDNIAIVIEEFIQNRGVAIDQEKIDNLVDGCCPKRVYAEIVAQTQY